MPPKAARVAANAADEQQAIALTIKGLCRDLRNYRRRQAHEKRLPELVGHGGRLLLWKTSGDQQLLAKFLQWRAPRQNDILAAWIDSLVGWYKALPPGHDGTGIGGDSPTQIASSTKMLETFFREERLHAWVQHQNQNLGISPSTATVLKQLRATELTTGTGEVVTSGRKYRSTLQYLRRWRRRWGISRGAFQPLDLDPPEVMRAKVSVARPA